MTNVPEQRIADAAGNARTGALAEAAVLADRVEANAFADMYAAAPPPLAQAVGLAAHRVGDATVLVAARIPDPQFNRVIGLGLSQPPSDDTLDAIAAIYAAAGVPHGWVHVHETEAGAALAARLSARGFVTARRPAWAKMIRAASPLPRRDASLRVREAAPDDARAVGEAIAASFGMPAPMIAWLQALACRPGWRAWAVDDASDAQAVDGASDAQAGPRDGALESAAAPAGGFAGGGFLYVDPASGAGWLGAGGVRASFRRRGAHRALMLARLQAAYDAGCAVVITETGEPVGDEPNPSLRNMVACGFTRVSRRLNMSPAA